MYIEGRGIELIVVIYLSVLGLIKAIEIEIANANNIIGSIDKKIEQYILRT